MRNRGLVAAAPTDGKTSRSKWTEDRLVITPAGLAAIGVEAADSAPGRPAARQEAKPASTSAANPERPGGKLGILLDAIAGPTGATLDELSTASGWLPHTTRAALTRLRQRGFDVRLAATDGRKAYHLVPAA